DFHVTGVQTCALPISPDNSLAEVQKSGVLRVCVPDTLPAASVADPGHPGYDIELLELVARDLGVRLAINRNSAIGADFNPRNWRSEHARVGKNMSTSK